jgi:hypothetical protein
MQFVSVAVARRSSSFGQTATARCRPFSAMATALPAYCDPRHAPSRFIEPQIGPNRPVAGCAVVHCAASHDTMADRGRDGRPGATLEAPRADP